MSRHSRSDIGLEATQVGRGGVASAGLQNSPKHPVCFQAAGTSLMHRDHQPAAAACSATALL